MSSIKTYTGVMFDPLNPESELIDILDLVLTPLTDTFDIHADNDPGVDVQEVRISLFTKGSYTKWKNTLVRAILAADITITERRYVGHDDDTGYHNYAIDVANYYELED